MERQGLEEEKEEEGEMGARERKGRRDAKTGKEKKMQFEEEYSQVFPVSALISYQLNCIAFQGENMKQCSSCYGRGGMSWTLHRAYSRELVVFHIIYTGKTAVLEELSVCQELATI